MFDFLFYIIIYYVNMLNFKKIFHNVRNLKMKIKLRDTAIRWNVIPSSHALDTSTCYAIIGLRRYQRTIYTLHEYSKALVNRLNKTSFL